MSNESKLWPEGLNAGVQNVDTTGALYPARRREQDEDYVPPGTAPDQPAEDTRSQGNDAFTAGFPKRLAEYVEQTEKMRIDNENFQRDQELSEAIGAAFSGAAATAECRAAFAGFDPADSDPQALEFRNYRSEEYDKFGYL